MPLPSVYSPAEVESRWYSEWESKGYFKPRSDSTKPPFTIVIPPPNVTGILHMGHALNDTLQDVLVRWKRMQGHPALWVPGTDHAGIATQNVVERQLAQEKLTRQQLGREKFVERVWAWKEKSGSTIVKQLRRLGASCDWSRERFTMDEGLSKAVQTTFIELYKAGLLYRGYYLVNWCPRCQTALSDEEVVHENLKGNLWHIRYPAQGSPDEGIIVATTRPETLLGDTAVAVHPSDDRYTALHGKMLVLPLLNRPVPVVADPFVDREFGTGAVKVTPAHDLNDYQLGQRHNLSAIRVIGSDGVMIAQAGPYAGLDRFAARKKIVADLEAAGLLIKTEPYAHSVGHCYRCKTVIEPSLSPQWFVKMEPLAKLGIEAIEKDGLRFIPERWNKVYLDWLHNIRDWCVSRQIWWGHRIPAWYCQTCYPAYLKQRETTPLSSGTLFDEKKAGIVVSPRKPAACPNCSGSNLVQDEDVLDTWFSSWLWPFSTLGWPDKTKDLESFYPTSALVTGQDIIFFWVARMVMAGKFFMKKIPFKDVYIHGIIRVEGGKKMSKSLGNIIDPIEVIDRLGTDALRFSIAQMTSEGQDLYLSENKFLIGRNFANKLWNASRLILDRPGVSELKEIHFNEAALTIPDQWILSRLQRLTTDVTRALEQYRFNETARLLYQFVWNDFCDWYLEIAKIQREEGDPAVAANTNAVLVYVLERTLRLLHPLMPFITEELWHHLGYRGIEAAPSISLAAWPVPDEKWINAGAEQSFERLQAVVSHGRTIRATFRVPPAQKLEMLIKGSKGLELIGRYEKAVQRLAGLETIRCGADIKRPAGTVSSPVSAQGKFDLWEVIVPLAGLVDLVVERQRIQKEMESLETRIGSKKSRLDDATFRSRAPADVVEEEETLLGELQGELLKWSESLKQLQ